MAIESIALVASGALYATAHVHKSRQKRKRNLWLPSTKASPIPVSLYTRVKNSIKKITQESIPLLLSDERSQQLRELTSETRAKGMSAEEKRVNHEMAVSFSALGLALGGIAIFPPLRLMSGLILVYRTVLLSEETYKKNLNKRKWFTVETLVLIIISALLVKGYLFYCALNSSLFSIANKLANKVKDNSRDKLVNVFRQQPRSVWIIRSGTEIEIPLETVQTGDIVVVHAGETVPVDGIISEGTASIDQHVLTGESQPAEKGPGDPVFALTTILFGLLYIRVEKAGEETTAAQIEQILNRTVDFKTNRLLWFEEVADRTVLPLIALSSLCLPIIGIERSLAALNTHLQRKMLVAGPISILNFFRIASQNGLLIKDGRTLELLTQVDTVVFDKTGTLTHEQPHVGQVHPCPGYTEDDVLLYAAIAEQRQSHPIARAILDAAQERALAVPAAEDTRYVVGYGLTVEVNGQLIRVGSLRFFETEGISIPPHLLETQDCCHRQGYSLVLVAVGTETVGALELRATIRPEAKGIIRGLRRRGIKTMYIISGDHEAPTRKIAQELGIDHYFAETLPENKAELIEQLQNEGKFVCFVGDGINDSIALKKAHVSVSLRGASSIAIDTAQAILMNRSLDRLCDLFDIASELDRNMKSTFRVILVPNLLSLGGVLFFSFGIGPSMFVQFSSLALGIGTALLPTTKEKWLSDRRGAGDEEGTLSHPLQTAEADDGGIVKQVREQQQAAWL